MRRGYFIGCITIILCGALLAAGCSKKEEAPGITGKEILIGNIQDLSGPMKELGYLLPAGAELYFRHVNEQGGVHGRTIKMIVEDHQYNPQKAVAMARKLIDKDEVFSLYQVIGTSPCEAISPILEETGVPLVAPATQSGALSSPTRPMIFHTDTGYDRQVQVLVKQILEEDKDAKIGLIYQDDDYGENVLHGVDAAEKEHGIKLQRESYQRGNADFSGQVGNLMKGGATHVIIAGIVKEPIIVMKTAAAVGYAPRFLGLSPTMDHRVALSAGPAGEGYTVANFIPLWNSDGECQKLYHELHEKYADKEKHKPGMYSYYGFATAHVLVEALKAAGEDLTREGFLKALNSLDYTGGCFQNLNWSEKHHGSDGSVMLVQVKDGKQVQASDWIR